jgi:C4-dicarboxylate-specific signal transduction histidine kinase
MMMKEISLHVLDIIQNSISAQAALIVIEVEVQHKRDWMRVAVRDDGRGMDGEFLQKVVSPFATSRTTRKVGLGIPMFKAGAQAAGGAFQLRSKPGVGTFIQAEYCISHWDRPPLGNMAETIYADGSLQ